MQSTWHHTRSRYDISNNVSPYLTGNPYNRRTSSAKAKTKVDFHVLNIVAKRSIKVGPQSQFKASKGKTEVAKAPPKAHGHGMSPPMCDILLHVRAGAYSGTRERIGRRCSRASTRWGRAHRETRGRRGTDIQTSTA